MTSRGRAGRSQAITHGRRRNATVWLPVLVVVAGLAVYANSFAGVFLFDDAVHIVQNERIRHLGSWSDVMDVIGGRRPVVDLSLAVNYALDGLTPRGYHAVNLGVHIAAALALYGVIRRTLQCEPLRGRFGTAAPWLALTASLLWVVHPLQTQSVTYVIQRAESMMGLFYLLTLYCVVRGATSARGCGWWYAASVACSALGMGSKGVMVTAPVMVLLIDRTCLAGSFAQALRRRWPLYLGLAATWWVLWTCGEVMGVLDPSRKAGTVGFSYRGITPVEYALTQFGVLVHYVRLSVWPNPLCLDYAWPVARTAAQIVLPAVIVIPLVLGTTWALIRRPQLALIGAWFFVILAPTSTVIPIKDTLFEHRMYLPLAAVIVGAVIGGHETLRRSAEHLSLTLWPRRIIAAVCITVTAGSLGYATVTRNHLYHDDVSMWRDGVTRRPHNARAFEQLGTALVAKGALNEAIEPYRRAVTIDPGFVSAHANLGNALTQTGRFAEAIPHYDRVRELDPDHVEARVNRGHAMDMLGRTEESIEAYREATRVDPRRTKPDLLAMAHYNLGSAVGRQGDFDGAIAHYREAVRLRPDYEKAHFSLASVLERQGHLDEAVEHYERALDINPRHEQTRRTLENLRSRRRGTPN